MRAEIFHIDAFTRTLFGGNSACVVILHEEIDKERMLMIAAENGVAETAFLLKKGCAECGKEGEEFWGLRWFTPDLEMDLCGHATLASAFVLYECKGVKRVMFDTCEGRIGVDRDYDSDGRPSFLLHFPRRDAKPAKLPDNIFMALNIKPKEVYLSRDYILLYSSAKEIAGININREEFDKINLGPGGVAVTAVGEECDFVSRFFTPQSTILEDPVTGSAHCTLAPFWAERLGRRELFAKQISRRCGELYCTVYDDEVSIKGYATLFSAGTIEL